MILGVESIEINEQILSQLKSYNFNIDYTRQCLINNRHNHVTTTYYLLKQKQGKLDKLDK
jgi:5'-AMP-activated protein kinase catalytic alpha subunit